MNHGLFYLHFKALEHSNSLKKRGLVVRTIQSNGFINIPGTSPGGSLPSPGDASSVSSCMSHSFLGREAEVTTEGK